MEGEPCLRGATPIKEAWAADARHGPASILGATLSRDRAIVNLLTARRLLAKYTSMLNLFLLG
jgi:hypothetical protein